MLSVQSPSYAGMERLGVPVRTSIGSSTDDRSHIGRRLRMDSLQSEDLLTDHHAIGTSNHLYHHVQSDVIRCPHHVALPDSERGTDRDVHSRTSFQQMELTRPYIKAPPNKTALDVPELSYNIFPHPSCNLNNQQRITTTTKSKPNPIAKFFLRISSKTTESTSCSPASTTTTNSTTLAHHHHPTQNPMNHPKNSSSSSSTLSIYKSDISTNSSIPSTKLYTSVPTSSTQSLATTTEPSPPESGSHI
ncbi:hypothetical protein HA402_011815 [Bradysia odoriphaga]|nr:hypothetical protein HA402_011815 [Bradysia odoriphaga]